MPSGNGNIYRPEGSSLPGAQRAPDPAHKAKRLLPEYMFEYSPANQIIQKITVPSNGSNYLIWRYQYDDRGLKVREAVFDKYKQLTGKIEYQYQFGS